MIDVIEKAKSGIYKNNPENRKLGRVGQRYGGKEQIAEEFRDAQVRIHSQYKDFITSLANKYDGVALVAPPKSLQRLLEKLNLDYGGDFTKAKDILRSTIVVDRDRLDDLVGNFINDFAHIQKENFLVKALIDFESETYQGANFVMEFKGYAVEVQVNTPVNIALKDNDVFLRSHPALTNTYGMLESEGIKPGMGHKYYEKLRSPESTEQEKIEADQMQKEYYKNRFKFLNRDKIDMLKKSWIDKIRDVFQHQSITMPIDESGQELSDIDISRRKLYILKSNIETILVNRDEIHEEHSFTKSELLDIAKSNIAVQTRLPKQIEALEDTLFNELRDNTQELTKAYQNLKKALEDHVDLLRQGDFIYKKYLPTSLGRTRDTMPQIDSDKIDDVILHFQGKSPDSKVTKEKFTIDKLKFVQGEINEDKVLKLIHELDIKKLTPFLVAKYKGEYWLIDGHHRLCAIAELDQEAEIQAYVIHLDPKEVIRRLNLMKITRNDDITKSLEDIFEKAINHKYIRKEIEGGRTKYIYEEKEADNKISPDDKKKLNKEIKELTNELNEIQKKKSELYNRVESDFLKSGLRGSDLHPSHIGYRASFNSYLSDQIDNNTYGIKDNYELNSELSHSLTEAKLKLKSDSLNKDQFSKILGFATKNEIVFEQKNKKTLPFRDVKKDVTIDDYYIATETVFKGVDIEDDVDIMDYWDNLKAKGNHVFSPKSSSEYIQTKDGVYRLSDHWGRCASCEWEYDPSEKSMQGRWGIGFSKISEFKPLGFSGGYYANNPDYYSQIEDKINDSLHNLSLVKKSFKLTKPQEIQISSKIDILEFKLKEAKKVNESINYKDSNSDEIKKSFESIEESNGEEIQDLNPFESYPDDYEELLSKSFSTICKAFNQDQITVDQYYEAKKTYDEQLEKAQVKYIKRTGVPGNYKYIYKEPTLKGKEDKETPIANTKVNVDLFNEILDNKPQLLNKVLDSEYSPVKRNFNKDNYYLSTGGTFNILKFSGQAFDLFKELKNKEGFIFKESPKSNSKYLIDTKNNTLYRLSDHWGLVASCKWGIDKNPPSWAGKTYSLAKINMSDLRDIGYDRFVRDKEGIFKNIVDSYKNFPEESNKGQTYKQFIDKIINEYLEVPSNKENEIQKAFDTITLAFDQDLISLEKYIEAKDNFEKARTGVYADNVQNRQLKRVGQKYGEGKKQDEQSNGKQGHQSDSKQSKTYSDTELANHAKNASEEGLNRQIKTNKDPKIREAAHKELERRQKEEHIQENKPKLNKENTKLKKSEQPESLTKENNYKKWL